MKKSMFFMAVIAFTFALPFIYPTEISDNAATSISLKTNTWAKDGFSSVTSCCEITVFRGSLDSAKIGKDGEFKTVTPIEVQKSSIVNGMYNQHFNVDATFYVDSLNVVQKVVEGSTIWTWQEKKE